MIYKNKKRLQIINYIFNKLNGTKGLSKEFVGKLVYMADKLFLLKYGCTITGDKFVAFERGTTCSETLAIMDMDSKHIEGKDKQIIEQTINTFKNIYNYETRENSKKVHKIFATNKLPNNFSALSNNEKEILDIILNRFGNMTDSEISKYTHNFLEWKNYDADKIGQIFKKQTLNMDDVFADETFLNDEVLGKYLNKEQIKIAQKVYNGEY